MQTLSTHSPGHFLKALYGFTLVELLVVVAIIVVLLALLMPALDRAVDQAERAVCATRLHGFGIAVPQHAMDHQRRLLSTVTLSGSSIPSPLVNNLINNTSIVPFPLMVWARSSDGPGQWSVEAMKPYLGDSGFDPGSAARILGKAWFCPSNVADVTVYNRAAPYMLGSYSYYARLDQWNNSSDRNFCTRPQDLTERSLSGGQLLMADNLYTEFDLWYLNHSGNGYSVVRTDMGGPIQGGKATLDAITGLNYLYGDGGVVWQDRSQFDTSAMYARDLKARWVGSNTGPNPASSYFHFY